ncbi:hypothetical protein ACRE_034980 [Hapsidospora chrysogenum ATCC 11550]|uniref:Mtf2-like C-terminal domain-containing protein n=1 Tax=Hapsidospora chrysogenum (strain ATCC 11550 / CBS 779.69 / DSM 880 / IAM 14645 / JCM 23072 / IMI 49137) TaxID=857340 RepID=A0A086T8D4_HAPC1|nr:hypothetical protein ACRE_034980 [Hapsidospora chrysogenum ATCC 11550]
MSFTLTPFLYRTRTIQRAWKCGPAFCLARLAHSDRGDRPPRDEAVPFDWGEAGPPKGLRPGAYDDLSHGSLIAGRKATLSPNEAQIFKRIFEEIAEGKMAVPKHRRPQQKDTWLGTTGQPRSLVEHARMSEFRDKYLERFPPSLRNAANKALGMFELQPSESALEEMTEEDRELWAERVRYRQLREDEKTRVETLMKECQTDFALWEVMEKEVFSIPVGLGLVPKPAAAKRKGRKGEKARDKIKEGERIDGQTVTDQTTAQLTEVSEANAEAAAKEESAKLVMDVHGALYSGYIIYGLQLFDAAFTRPSPLSFRILPRVKSLGLESYVLGVSTPFYVALAGLHWDRFGDAASALDVIQEMSSTGLYVNEEASALLGRIRDDLMSCTLGLQGPFVSAMMQAPPYDKSLLQRIERMENLRQDPVRGQVQIEPIADMGY